LIKNYTHYFLIKIMLSVSSVMASRIDPPVIYSYADAVAGAENEVEAARDGAIGAADLAAATAEDVAATLEDFNFVKRDDNPDWSNFIEMDEKLDNMCEYASKAADYAANRAEDAIYASNMASYIAAGLNTQRSIDAARIAHWAMVATCASADQAKADAEEMANFYFSYNDGDREIGKEYDS